MPKTTKVKISGNRGSVVVTVPEGSNVRDVLVSAATTLGIDGYVPAAALVDGQPAPLDNPVPDEAQEVKGVPAARLG